MTFDAGKRAEPICGLWCVEVVVEVRAAGINYADVIVRMGLYASAKELVGWPVTPGFEVSGRGLAVGSEVTGLKLGAPVIAVTRFFGYAGQVCVPWGLRAWGSGFSGSGLTRAVVHGLSE